jgi:hypothetical protein
VVAIDKTSKTLKWILADPAGWAEEYEPYLLKAEQEDLAWSYGQHQLTLLGNGELLMFDNGEFGRVKAMNEVDALAEEDNYSRAVIYKIDEDEKTVQELWSFGEELGSECYAGSMSGVQCLDKEKGRYLITFGTCTDSDGNTATHVYLIDNDDIVWNLNYTGSSTYRGYQYSLSDGTVFDPQIKGYWHGDLGTTEQLEDVSAEEGTDVAVAEAVKVELFPFDALHFSGSFTVEDESLLSDYYVVLEGDEKRYTFDLGYIQSPADNGKLATLSRWISLKGLDAGNYSVKAVIMGKEYDLGKSVTVAG